MKLRAGTSGFSYPEWRGGFYPEDLAADAMLAHYAKRLPSVEINNTFYRMPKPEVLAGWGASTPEAFSFALKASRRITHMGKLRGIEDSVAYLLNVVAALGDKLGVVLFQLPPVLRRDDEALAGLLELLPEGFRAALEVRHASWLDETVFSALRDKNVALVAGDPDEGGPVAPLVRTADFGYLRLRAEDYSDADIAAWHARIAGQPWREAFAFFKHETKGPEYALRLQALAEGRPAPEQPRVGPGLAQKKPDKPGLARDRPGAGRGRKRSA